MLFKEDFQHFGGNYSDRAENQRMSNAGDCDHCAEEFSLDVLEKWDNDWRLCPTCNRTFIMTWDLFTMRDQKLIDKLKKEIAEIEKEMK